MAGLPVNSSPAFEEAINVTPLDSHRYSAILQDEWCIGTVPHGGYTTAVLYRLALTHFAHTHPTLYDAPATPISIQLSFLRRTTAGPAVLTVQDMKLGARTSTIHVSLCQPSEKKVKQGELEVKVAGYITVSPPTAEVGFTFNTEWSSQSAAQGSGPNGSVNLTALGQTGRDGKWVRLKPSFPKFRRATRQVEVYGPDPGLGKPKVIQQWSRFRPGGDPEARWTNEAVAFLADVFPLALSAFDQMALAASTPSQESTEQTSRFWYPTVTLNVDFKKRLPAQGAEWLYSQVHTKVVRDGRTDLDVVILDEQGDVVASSTQVGLMLSASRNVGQRQMKM
ncbi:thioesterase-like superfamily-domain-containing protein [Aspergillus coremiiformis]|uniref:Thioesterase-like superfamily-domain-containing protein n=1 Tax=Aspergillus coremiiformis TaxID=138285 RepID=A0A5N6YWH2_9EURO|nr:thioesterase-like superfamily-domain-containing protein [Aspergillus coremiiformis]